MKLRFIQNEGGGLRGEGGGASQQMPLLAFGARGREGGSALGEIDASDCCVGVKCIASLLPRGSTGRCVTTHEALRDDPRGAA